jgi:dimethylaniline monooxygenase (N-oxide forming)
LNFNTQAFDVLFKVEFGYFNYPGQPMSRDGKPDNNLVSGDMIQRYLEKFAVENDLMRRIRFNSWVSKVERCPRGWRLEVNGRIYESSKLILATGVTSVPNQPPFKVEAEATVTHSRDIAQNLPVLKETESVVVVGAAKSAYDAVYLLCSLGKRVTWVIRPDGSGPMPLMPHQIGGMNTITGQQSTGMSLTNQSIG